MGIFDNLVENRGVQMMLVNMLKAAAPDLAQHVDDMARMVAEFNDRLKSLQVRQQQCLEIQQQILQRLEANNDRTNTSNGERDTAEIGERTT